MKKSEEVVKLTKAEIDAKRQNRIAILEKTKFNTLSIQGKVNFCNEYASIHHFHDTRYDLETPLSGTY